MDGWPLERQESMSGGGSPAGIPGLKGFILPKFGDGQGEMKDSCRLVAKERGPECGALTICSMMHRVS